MSFSIAGKTAIITGAAEGIGLAVARHFVARGANVMLADNNEARLLAEIGDEVEALKGEGRIRTYAGNLCQKLTIANLLSATVDVFERIDILVNAERRWALSDPLDPEGDAVDKLWNENVMTTLRLSQLTARRMISQSPKNSQDKRLGSIINLSSIASIRTQPELLAYSVASAAIEQITRSLALALAPEGIRVNALSFGSVMSASLQDTLKAEPDFRDELANHTPVGRIAMPDELAEAIQFLASDASSFMTGQVMTLDGGRSLADLVRIPAF